MKLHFTNAVFAFSVISFVFIACQGSEIAEPVNHPNEEKPETKDTSNFIEPDEVLFEDVKFDNETQSLAHGKRAAKSSNRFASDLMNHYIHSSNQKGKNIFFSPFSISTAISMTAEGAGRETQKEIRNVFHLPENDSLRQWGFFGLISSIDTKQKNYKLNTSNALWIQKDEKMAPPFLNVTSQYYLARAETVDFKNKPEESRQVINQYVEQKTENKIKDLIPKGIIKPETKLILTNTIYFKADWKNKFKANDTHSMLFTTSNEKESEIQMMSQTDYFDYFENDDFQVLEMQYKNDAVSMLVILPSNENDFSKIDRKTVVKMLDVPMKKEEIDLRFPKFKFETNYLMKENLSRLGMPAAFTNSADFSRINTEKKLKIDEVIHKAFIEVGEDGTEAAAATAVVMAEITSIQPVQKTIKTFHADHPFMFVIRHNATGAILFMGIMNHPD